MVQHVWFWRVFLLYFSILRSSNIYRSVIIENVNKKFCKFDLKYSTGYLLRSHMLFCKDAFVFIVSSSNKIMGGVSRCHSGV